MLGHTYCATNFECGRYSRELVDVIPGSTKTMFAFSQTLLKVNSFKLA